MSSTLENQSGSDDVREAEIPRAYTRVYTDADGHSCFEDITLRGFSQGVTYATLVATFADVGEIEQVLFRNVTAEADDTVPHNAPRRQFIIQLRGVSEVETSRGECRQFGPGSVILLEDVAGRGHITRNVGEGERLTLLITLKKGNREIENDR